MVYYLNMPVDNSPNLAKMIRLPAMLAVPSHRYYTAKGVFVEVGGHQHKSGDDNIYVRVVGPEGKVEKTMYPVPPEYHLFDPTRNKTGRPPHKSKTWRGKAHRSPERANAVVKTAVDLGFALKGSANYYSLSWEGHRAFVVFKAGEMGFGKVIPPEFDTLPFYVATSSFLPQRLPLTRLDIPTTEYIFKLTKYLERFKAEHPKVEVEKLLGVE